MKTTKLKIPDSPSVLVHLCEDDSELIQVSGGHHPDIKPDLDMIPDGLCPAGLTIGTAEHVHVYLSGNLREPEKKQTIAHEALHVTNCILRHRIYGTMDKERMLIISDSTELHIPGIESLKLRLKGIDEEDQANLNGLLNFEMSTAIEAMENG